MKADGNGRETKSKRDDIYDRSLWPSPTDNAIIRLLERDDDWFTNQEVVVALGLDEGRALLSNCLPTFARMLGEDDTAVTAYGQTFTSSRISPAHSGRGNVRLFSRRALVLAAMRTNTPTAAAYRDWLATQAADYAPIKRLELS